MSDYKEAVANGEVKSWTRAYKVEIDNRYEEVPYIRFLEEKKTILPDGRVISESQGAIREEFDPSRVIELISPVDGSSLGQATLQQLQLILYSYYIDMATKRDLGEN